MPIDSAVPSHESITHRQSCIFTTPKNTEVAATAAKSKYILYNENDFVHLKLQLTIFLARN